MKSVYKKLMFCLMSLLGAVNGVNAAVPHDSIRTREDYMGLSRRDPVVREAVALKKRITPGVLSKVKGPNKIKAPDVSNLEDYFNESFNWEKRSKEIKNEIMPVLIAIEKEMGEKFIREAKEVCEEIEDAIEQCLFEFITTGYVGNEKHERFFAAFDKVESMLVYAAGAEYRSCHDDDAKMRCFFGSDDNIGAFCLAGEMKEYAFNAARKMGRDSRGKLGEEYIRIYAGFQTIVRALRKGCQRLLEIENAPESTGMFQWMGNLYRKGKGWLSRAFTSGNN